MINKAFGELVRKKRLALNLSQRELALRAKRSATYINYVERGYNPSAKNGKFQPGVDAVRAIAQVLDIPTDEALHAAGYASGEPFPKPVTAAQALAIIEKLLPGFDGVSLADGLTDDNAERLLEDFKTLIELQNRRLQK